jgi:glycosyltransferase involved in cell wall biosynthesis
MTSATDSTRRFFIANCSGDTFASQGSGAIGIHAWEVAKAASRAGYEPIVLSRRGNGLPFPLSDARFIRWSEPQTRVTRRLWRYAHGLGGRWLPSSHELYADRLARAIGAYPPPRRVLFGNDPEVVVRVRQRLPDARLVHLLHNVHPVAEEMKAVMLESADRLAAVSSFTARACEAEYGAPPGAVAVVYNGVDLDAFAPPKRERQARPPLIGFVGTFSPLKGLDLLLDALIALRGEGYEFRVRLLGDYYLGMEHVDRYKRSVEAQLDELRRYRTSVESPGRVSRDEVMQLMSDSDIVVVPSRVDEAFCLVLAEAMASGAAVLAAQVGGIPEVLADAGLSFERDSSVSLEMQLRRLLSDSGLRAALGRSARARVERFSWDNTWAALRPLLFDRKEEGA